jgi:ABC-type sugar transport system ATPase subunit
VSVNSEVPGVATELLRVLGVTKRFGHVRALEGVDLSVQAGEVLALVGDNGAGKSTLMKVIAGVMSPDAGELFLRGGPVSFRSPADARRQGIAAVFQDLALVECLDIATNVFLGEIPRRRLFVNRRLMDAETSEVLRRMNVAVHSPRTPVGLLPAGHRQVIAVARAVRSDSRVVVMDEPTAALGVSEKARVADLIDRLKAERKAVILVSHDLQLVFDHADRIQVLRLGRTAGVRVCCDTDRDEIVGLITGARE